MKQDEDHLKLLSIFHYVAAGMAAVFSLFPIIHLIFGLFILLAPETLDNKGEPPPAFLGWLFVLFPAVVMVIGWTFAAFVFVAGRFLAQRKHYLFCLVVAGVECIFMPVGTALGVFTIIVLMRESVKQLFNPGTATTQTS
jgi:hypothetical protein